MSMDKPTATYTSSSASSSSPMPSTIPDPSIRAEAWNQLIQNRGILFKHKLSAPCPNLNGLETNSHVPDCPVCDNAGIIYYATKDIVGFFSSSSLEKVYERQGVWEIGSALCTFPTEYSDGTQADFQTFDKLEIQDFEIRVNELKEFEPREDNQQALRYPITKIDYIASAVNNVLVPYTLTTDYTIVNGKIQWVTGQEPSYDPTTGRGDVVVISYFCKPVYVVQQPLRELRVTQQMENGVKVAKRLPQHVLCKRDFLLNPSEKLADQ